MLKVRRVSNRRLYYRGGRVGELVATANVGVAWTLFAMEFANATLWSQNLWMKKTKYNDMIQFREQFPRYH